MNLTDQQIEAKKQISVLVNQAAKLLTEAEVIADKYNVDFYWGYEYGMGGSYVPKGSKNHWFDKYEAEISEDGSLLEGKWLASSHSC